jgi:hypothetical protein
MTLGTTENGPVPFQQAAMWRRVVCFKGTTGSEERAFSNSCVNDWCMYPDNEGNRFLWNVGARLRHSQQDNSLRSNWRQNLKSESC